MSNVSIAATRVEPKFSPANRSVVEGIVSHAITNGDGMAVYDGATKLTYQELISWAAALSAEIEALPEPELPVGIFLPSSAAYMVATLALLTAGRTSVPMDNNHPEERNRKIIGRAGLGSVIVDSKTAPLMRQIAPTLRQVLVAPARPTIALPSALRATASPDSIFTISFTSGSTDEPKGVCISEKGLSHRFYNSVQELALTADDRFPIVESLSAAVCTRHALNALLVGAQVGIIDLQRNGLSVTRRLLGEFRPTVYAMVSSTFRALFGPDDAEILARGVRWVRLAGDVVQHSDVDLYRRRFAETCRLVVALAATETGLFALWRIDHGTPLDWPTVPVGYPARDIELELIGEDGAAVRPGEIGEIFVTGAAVAVGYWRDEALTRARFSRSTKYPGMLRYRTGDLGRFLPNGLLEFLGRRDRQVKIRGARVHPGEVESCLARCPGVAEVGVVARQSAEGIVLVAYCTPGAGGALAEEQLRRWCRDGLPAAMRPTHFFFPAALPRLSNGKLDLIELAALDARQARSTIVPTATEGLGHTALSGVVRQAWTGVLSAESFDADAAFDAAGGDSLKALDLQVRLESLLGRPVAVGTLDLETRPSELIRRLLEAVEPEPATHGTRPFVVLFPATAGDDVSTSDFYRRLSQRFRAIAIDPRLGGDALAGDYDAARYFAAAVAAIHRTGSHERLWLIGYCAGGKLAAETARRLLACGTAVEAVIVLDGIGRPPPHRPPMLWLRLGLAVHGVWRYLLIGFVRRAKWFATLETRLKLVSRLGSRETYRHVSRYVIAVTRTRAFGDLPAPASALPMALWLLVTGDFLRPEHLGWEEWFQKVHTISVGGAHDTMLAPPTRDVIIAELARLETALRAPSPIHEAVD